MGHRIALPNTLHEMQTLGIPGDDLYSFALKELGESRAPNVSPV